MKKDEITDEGFEEIADTEGRNDEIDDIMAKVENILGSIQPGFSISIYRVKPTWCKGFLERIETLDAEPPDLEYLADTWGGDILRLRVCDKHGTYRGGVDVPMMSYPPKFQGRKLFRNIAQDAEDALPKTARIDGQTQPQIIQMPSQQPSNPIEQFVTLLKQTQNMSAENWQLMRDLTANMRTEPPAVGNAFGNVLEFAQQFKQLQEVFGGAQEKIQDDQSALFSTIAEIVKAVTTIKQAPAQPRLVHHNAPQHVQQHSQPGPQPGPQPIPNNPTELLSKLSPDQFADLYVMSLARMPMEQREKTVQAVMTRLGLDNELENINGDDSDEYEDENGDTDR